MTAIKFIPIGEISPNKGQIPGVPKNPRFIRDERFTALKKSITDFPDGLSLRELIVYPLNGKYVVLGGNMRLRACKDLGYKEMPCKVVDENTPSETLRRIVVMDNTAFGQNDFDVLANEFDAAELAEFGLELDWLDPDFGVQESGEGDDLPGEEEAPAADDTSVKPMVQILFDDEFARDRFVASYTDVIKVDYAANIKVY